MKPSLASLGIIVGISLSTPTPAQQTSLDTVVEDRKTPIEAIQSPAHHTPTHTLNWYELRSFSISYLGGQTYEQFTKEKTGKKYGDHGYKNHEKTFTSLEDYLGISRGILSAFGYAESLISQPAVSWAKAQGIMQIHPTGYMGAFRQDYNVAQQLVNRYVDEPSLEKLQLNARSTEQVIIFKIIPKWKDLEENLPDVAAHLRELYSIRDTRRDKVFFSGTPSDKELETIIRHVYAPYYKGVRDLKRKYFGNKLPSYPDIVQGPTKNIVLGALIYDLGRRQLSILSLDTAPQGVVFRWTPPEEKNRVIHPRDLEILTYSPYNAGINATKYRLKLVLDKMSKSKKIRSLTISDLSRPRTLYNETRKGMYRIKRWLDHFTLIPQVVDDFVKGGYKKR